MRSRTVYRSRATVQVIFFCAIGAVFIAAPAFLDTEPGPVVNVALRAMGSLAIVVGVATWRTRVVVDELGVVMTPRLFRGFRLDWDSVKTWTVSYCTGSDDVWERAVHFTLQNGSVREVLDCDVAGPGFDAFLADVRERLPDREVGVDV